MDLHSTAEQFQFPAQRTATFRRKSESLVAVAAWAIASLVVADEPAGPPPPPAIAPFDAEQAKAHQEAWAKHLGTAVEISNSLGMKMRLIPPGEFLMGSPPSEKGRAEDELQHRVLITKSFYLGRCEVTQQEYERLMARNPSKFSGRDNGSQHPVEVVNWQDAFDFCNNFPVKERLKPYYNSGTREVREGNGYRLPTEAEWEYACRAGTTTRWSFGDDENDLPRYAWVDSNSERRTHPVGELGANQFGLHDMHGNVWEWCWDWHGEYAAAVASDPTGPAAGIRRVLRGGAFIYLPKATRCAFRNHYVPTYRFSDFGFRVARLTIAR